VARRQWKGREGLAQEGKEWEIWIRLSDSLPLYALRNVPKVPCAVLGVCTPTRASQMLTRARACQSVCVGQTSPVRKKVKCSAGVTHRSQQSRGFRNLRSNCIGTHDATAARQACNMGNHHSSASSAKGHTTAQRANAERTLVTDRTTMPQSQSRSYSRRNTRGRKILAPPAGSPPFLRWVRGALSVPCKSGTPAYKLQTTVRSKACNNILPRIPQYWAHPPYVGGLLCCHASCSSGSRLPVREGSGTATRPAAPDPASLRGRAPGPPRVP
jgi:hypothetical protein